MTQSCFKSYTAELLFAGTFSSHVHSGAELQVIHAVRILIRTIRLVPLLAGVSAEVALQAVHLTANESCVITKQKALCR